MKHPKKSSSGGRNPVRVEIVGGVGNQLFGYAAGLFASVRLNTGLVMIDQDVKKGFTNHGSTIRELNLTCSYENRSVFTDLRLAIVSRAHAHLANRFPRLAQRLSERLRVFIASEIGYESRITTTTAGFYYRGYFQTYKYYEHLRAIGKFPVPELLSPSSAYQTQVSLIEAASPIVVHVRRGDYRKLSDNFGLLATEYYEAAITMLRSYEKFKFSPIWVFSDEPEAVEIEFEGSFMNEQLYFPDVSQCSPVEVLLLMSKGSASVISNSTFGWWGAILKNAGPTVAPTKWFRNQDEPLELIPPTWLRCLSVWREIA